MVQTCLSGKIYSYNKIIGWITNIVESNTFFTVKPVEEKGHFLIFMLLVCFTGLRSDNKITPAANTSYYAYFLSKTDDFIPKSLTPFCAAANPSSTPAYTVYCNIIMAHQIFLGKSHNVDKSVQGDFSKSIQRGIDHLSLTIKRRERTDGFSGT